MRVVPLQKLGFIVVFALLAQILAPIGGIWAATAKSADPLFAAVICSGSGPHQSSDNDTALAEHGACCPLCAVAQPVSLPENAATGLVQRLLGEITWGRLAEGFVVAKARGHAQARAPPVLSE